MLNERTCALLTMLSSISDTCVLRYPTTIINDECKSVIARLDLSGIEDEFEPIGLNCKIGKLTSMLSMIKEPSVTREGNALNIIDKDGIIKSVFVLDSVDLLNNTEFKNDVFDRIVNSLTVAEFQLTKDDLMMLKKAHGVYNDLDDVIIDADECISLSLGALNKFNRSENLFSISKDCEPLKQFKCAVAFDNIQRIPTVNYEAVVKFSEKTGSYALVLKNNELGIQIIISILVR